MYGQVVGYIPSVTQVKILLYPGLTPSINCYYQ